MTVKQNFMKTFLYTERLSIEKKIKLNSTVTLHQAQYFKLTFFSNLHSILILPRLLHRKNATYN